MCGECLGGKPIEGKMLVILNPWEKPKKHGDFITMNVDLMGISYGLVQWVSNGEEWDDMVNYPLVIC